MYSSRASGIETRHHVLNLHIKCGIHFQVWKLTYTRNGIFQGITIHSRDVEKTIILY